uniref:HTH psq-type domain-containing protein n=1 Tax=Heliothis virescens TaxID=7102 RepID=A0A2A4K6Z2_HELVI
MDHGIPLNIHARPRLVGRRPNEIVNIETDVFQEKSYKQYSSQHLRDALIAVKKGYSVYAASNKYGVPRKTLRNWMEKYDIKSQFSKEFPIANVQCQYDSPSDTEPERAGGGDPPAGEGGPARPPADHTYDTRDEPPAFIIRHVNNALHLQSPPHFREIRPKIMTIGPVLRPSSASVNVIHVGDQAQSVSSPPMEYSMNKRIRRSEVELRQAADCVSRGLTFQTVSEQFNIPISTIRFFMARKGILPRRRRGRSTAPNRPCSSPEPPFHMQHFKLPDMVALRADDEDPPAL